MIESSRSLQSAGSFAGTWVKPSLLLSCISLTLFWTLYALDFLVFDHLFGVEQGTEPLLSRYFSFSPEAITDALSALAGVVAAILGIVITVVSIDVQLSAARFAGITKMFSRDRTNLLVIGFYVVVCVCGLWLSVALKSDYVPHLALSMMLVLTTLSVVLMVPYFGYVFGFLEPMNIIAKIRQEALNMAKRGAEHRGESEASKEQESLLRSMEELTDIASGSISGKDKIIASGAVDALKDLALGYLGHKSGAKEAWFRVHQSIRKNPDFVAMDPESLSDLEERHTWVEWKVMRQYLGIYNEALGTMRDINYLIAIDTRYLGEAAARAQDDELVRLVYRFMNSYLRATLNAKDIRTAYNVLNQYRLLVESMLEAGQEEAALEGLRHMIYYGHVSFDRKLTFVTETVAYDVSALVQVAHESSRAIELPMLDSFLELDRPLRALSQENALIGVRKAQVKLAAFYLSQGLEERARRIADDMREEPEERLKAIRTALLAVKSKDFWEITDRGRNFDFMPDAERRYLPCFFEWLGVEPESPGLGSA
ncbi:MAG: DUF2254 domain-containing protein [Polyangiaceae bacterium]|nr:DUF2254 domain-containing protein [Polyangiaceae bacterium]